MLAPGQSSEWETVWAALFLGPSASVQGRRELPRYSSPKVKSQRLTCGSGGGLRIGHRAGGGQLGKGDALCRGECGWQWQGQACRCGLPPAGSPQSPDPDAPVIMQTCRHINPSTLLSTVGGLAQHLPGTELSPQAKRYRVFQPRLEQTVEMAGAAGEAPRSLGVGGLTTG